MTPCHCVQTDLEAPQLHNSDRRPVLALAQSTNDEGCTALHQHWRTRLPYEGAGWSAQVHIKGGVRQLTGDNGSWVTAASTPASFTQKVLSTKPACEQA
jgi:hypothetical protein